MGGEKVDPVLKRWDYTCSEWSCGVEGTPEPPTATTRCSASYTSCQRKPEGSDTKRARI